MSLNLNHIKPVTSSRVFMKIQKGKTIFVPLDIAKVFAQNLLGTKEVPNYATESAIQEKLDYAFKNKISPWKVVVKS